MPKKLASTRKLAAIALVFSLLGFGCGEGQETPEAEPLPTAVRVDAASKRDLYRQVAYVGTVQSRQEVTILAQVPGTVSSLAREGAAVEAGQALARISSGEIDARTSRLEAELRRAVTERDHLCKTYEAHRQLGEVGAVSKNQVDTSKKACEAADAAVSAARAARREAGAGARKTVEQAPFDGRVLRWLVEPGRNVMPGTPLMVFGGHELELRVPVAERDIQQGIAPGGKAFVRKGEARRPLQVSEVAPMASGPSRSVTVRLDLPEGWEPALGHGMSARVELVLDEANDAVAVPAQAVRTLGEKSAVFVVEGDTAFEMSVTTGIRDGRWVEVLGDVSAKDAVAVSNLDVLEDGAPVYPVFVSKERGELP